MNFTRYASLLFLAGVTVGYAAESVFSDNFKGQLGTGWSWVREYRDGWRVTEQGLEVRVQPGNMWGPPNNARNVLVRPAPEPSSETIIVSVGVENQPREQYEQADLVWYYDDSHMVKIGQELVDGKLSIVMGREEADRTRTIAIIPIQAYAVQVRFLVRNTQIRGQFRAVGDPDWREVGELTIPVKGVPKISLQCYQGPVTTERWVRFTNFRIDRDTPAPSVK